MSWTDDRVETLKRMWLDGASASQIAKELGSVTRNAVIGKVHRLGLSNRGGEGEAAAAVAAETPSAPASSPAPEPEATPAVSAGDDAPGDEPLAPAEPAAREPDPVASATGAEGADAGDDAAEAGPEPAVPFAATAPIPFRRPIPGQPQPPAPSEISPEAMAKMREVEATAKRLSLMELTEKTCKWPVGDPATTNFWFCGTPVQAGKPYCEAHVAVAFQPMSARRDRRR